MPTFSLYLLLHSFLNVSLLLRVHNTGTDDFLAIVLGGNCPILEAPYKPVSNEAGLFYFMTIGTDR
jgi:hypothetical protein